MGCAPRASMHRLCESRMLLKHHQKACCRKGTQKWSLRSFIARQDEDRIVEGAIPFPIAHF